MIRPAQGFYERLGATKEGWRDISLFVHDGLSSCRHSSLCPPDLAFGWSAEEIAHRAGVGAEANPSFGEHPGLEGNERFESLYWVAKLHDGRFNAVGSFAKAWSSI